SPATAVSQTTTTTAVAYGYSVDSKGFMGADFNKAAGLPDGFKIHKSTIDELVANSYRTLGWENAISTTKATFTNIDVANTIGQYFNIFSQIVDTSKKAFSTSELNALPAGYDFVGKENWLVGLKDFENMVVTHKFDGSQMNELENLAKFMPGVMPRKLDFSPASMRTDNAMYGFAPDMSVYESGEEYSIESVFVSFLKAHDASALKGGSTKLSYDLSLTYSFGSASKDLEAIFGQFEKYWEERISALLQNKDNDAKEKAKEAFFRAQAIFNEAQIWDDKEQNHPNI
ncbi:MAG: hypothetical protein MSA54_07925, partial [Campylobacter sp.]|nr:hypothetical protein [Campylobacter sp.]